MIELKTPGEIDAIDAAGSVVGTILAAVRAKAAPGVTPLDLDRMADDLMQAAGAVSSFRGYHPNWSPGPYPSVLCVSVNDAVVHGIPTADPLQPGDLLSVDYAVHLDGWCADAAFSVVVGEPVTARDQHMIDTTERALAAGIAAARPGARMGDIGAAIGAVARREKFGMLADHGGHGVGRSMHEEPHVANEGKPGKGMKLRAGLVLAIEPMLISGGTDRYRHDPDGWTLRTADGSRAAHVEHTIAITEAGPRVLTMP